MSLRLNEEDVISEVYHGIAADQIQLIAAHLPDQYLQRLDFPCTTKWCKEVFTTFTLLIYFSRLLSWVGKVIGDSPHIEFHLLWCVHLFNHHGSLLKAPRSSAPMYECSILVNYVLPMMMLNSSFYSSGAATSFPAILRDIHKGLSSRYSALSKMYVSN